MSKGKTCDACGGRGTVAYATEVMKCSACNGTGTISDSSTSTDGGKK